MATYWQQLKQAVDIPDPYKTLGLPREAKIEESEQYSSFRFYLFLLPSLHGSPPIIQTEGIGHSPG